MTKCIVLGGEDVKDKGKPIVFVKAINDTINNCKVRDANDKPWEWKFIELVCRQETQGAYDVMFAYDENRAYGLTYLGYWNDGFVKEES